MSLRDRLPKSVTIVEVSPRDGLQAEAKTLPTETKLALIDRLQDAGLRVVEATSFVNPKAIPQLADADEVMKRLVRRPGARYPVLVPNERGLERALAAGVDEIAVFAAASESYSRKNLNRSRDEAIEMFRPVVKRAKEARLRVRGYLSMVFADPWEGPIAKEVVVDAGRRLLELGCEELSLGDTIGAGTAAQVQDLIGAFGAAGVPPANIGVHFHDTYGQGLASVLAAMEAGVTVIDASAGGIGGSPYANSAAGNLATEDLVFMLDGLGIECGVDLKALVATSQWLGTQLGHELPGRAARALAAQHPLT